MGGPDTDYINPKKLINLSHDTKNTYNTYTTHIQQVLFPSPLVHLIFRNKYFKSQKSPILNL